MSATGRVLGAGAMVAVLLALCSCPAPDRSSSSGSSESISSASTGPDLGPSGPAPWTATLAEIGAAPTQRVALHREQGDVYTYLDFLVGALGTLRLAHNARTGAAKWVIDESPPQLGQFAPAGGLRELRREPIIMGERVLYTIEGGPLAGWYLVADVDGGRVAQVHVANRQYLREPGELHDFAVRAGLH